jgi:D-lyxose ketol-isomerase
MASADAADAVSVVAADGTIRHYTCDGSVSLEPGGGGGA